MEYVVESQARCPVCRVPLPARLVLAAYEEAHNESALNLGPDHPDTKVHRLNRASAMAIAGHHEESLRELESLRADESIDPMQRTVCCLEAGTVLTEIGRSEEAVCRLRDVVADLRQMPGPMSELILAQASLSMGRALMKQNKYTDACRWFQCGLDTFKTAATCRSQLPISKLLQGMACCLEKEGDFELALECHKIRCEKVLVKASDVVDLTRAELEWSQSEIRCAKHGPATSERLAAITRKLRQAGRGRDPRIRCVLQDALRCLDELWPEYRPTKRLRGKTHLEDLM